MRPDIDSLLHQAVDVINKNKIMIVECEYRKQHHRELITACELLALELHRVINQTGEAKKTNVV